MEVKVNTPLKTIKGEEIKNEIVENGKIIKSKETPTKRSLLSAHHCLK